MGKAQKVKRLRLPSSLLRPLSRLGPERQDPGFLRGNIQPKQIEPILHLATESYSISFVSEADNIVISVADKASGASAGVGEAPLKLQIERVMKIDVGQ